MEATQKEVTVFEDVSDFITKKLEAKAAKKEERKLAPQKEREFLIDRDLSGLYYVRYEGGGKLPEILKGKFTSITLLETAIDRYKAQR